MLRVLFKKVLYSVVSSDSEVSLTSIGTASHMETPRLTLEGTVEGLTKKHFLNNPSKWLLILKYLDKIKLQTLD